MVKISLPLEVVTYRPKTPRGKVKKFILNLNNYRNAPFHLLATAKTNYHDLIAPLFPEGVRVSRASMAYVYHHGNNRKIDYMNPVSIIDKFVCDTITKLGIWEDDNSDILEGHLILPGKPDKENPRCDLWILNSQSMKPILISYLKTGKLGKWNTS